MKIDAGKYYKTRSGAKVYIGFKSRFFARNPMMGEFEHDGADSWTEEGCYLDKETESEYDLISEWTDEPKIKLLDYSAIIANLKNTRNK